MLVDAVKAVNAHLIVWSGLESMADIIGGKYKFDASDSKADREYTMESGIPLIVAQVGIYTSNFTDGLFKPQRQTDDSYVVGVLFGPFKWMLISAYLSEKLSNRQCLAQALRCSFTEN